MPAARPGSLEDVLHDAAPAQALFVVPAVRGPAGRAGGRARRTGPSAWSTDPSGTLGQLRADRAGRPVRRVPLVRRDPAVRPPAHPHRRRRPSRRRSPPGSESRRRVPRRAARARRRRPAGRAAGAATAGRPPSAAWPPALRAVSTISSHTVASANARSVTSSVITGPAPASSTRCVSTAARASRLDRSASPQSCRPAHRRTIRSSGVSTRDVQGVTVAGCARASSLSFGSPNRRRSYMQTAIAYPSA